jgi:hypothetical protein
MRRYGGNILAFHRLREEALVFNDGELHIRHLAVFNDHIHRGVAFYFGYVVESEIDAMHEDILAYADYVAYIRQFASPDKMIFVLDMIQTIFVNRRKWSSRPIYRRR